MEEEELSEAHENLTLPERDYAEVSKKDWEWEDGIYYQSCGFCIFNFFIMLVFRYKLTETTTTKSPPPCTYCLKHNAKALIPYCMLRPGLR